MKFFKHFTDAHRGQSLQGLMDELSHMGLTYWIIVEMCVEKVGEKLDSKGPGYRLNKDDCEFEFHQRILRQSMRVSLTNLKRILDECSTLDLLSYEMNENIVKIKMPKILKSLERTKKKDVKFTSNERPNDVLDIEENKDKNKEDIDWNYEAEVCLQAVRKFKSDSLAMGWLGPSREAYINDIGGLSFLRSLKHNSWETNRLASLIKNSWESLRSEA